MTQYDDRVEYQRKLLAAEEFVNKVKGVHAHRLDSMWYETEKTKHLVKDGVVDTEYMDGRIERLCHDGTKMTLIEGKTGRDLVSYLEGQLQDMGKELG
jgi:hypothetical protein